MINKAIITKNLSATNIGLLNFTHNVTANIDKIAHFHAAGNPGRHELTVGEIHYPSVFEAIQATDYEAYVGLEYWPVRDPAEGLGDVAGWFEGSR